MRSGRIFNDFFINILLIKYKVEFLLISLTEIKKCLKYNHPERAETKFFFDGFWVPGPRNPGRYARFYGIENLKHVTWHRVTQNIYEDFNGFEKCTKNHYPMHACLRNYAPDGNIQFREDSRIYNF